MGAMADAIAAYGQPLIDATDGSLEEVQHAMAMTTLCYNLALAPAGERDETLNDLKLSSDMSDEEFESFKCDVIAPMIKRHEEMFPRFQKNAPEPETSQPPSPGYRKAVLAGEPYPGTGPYEPCPCESGNKYKFCCKKKTRNS